MFARTISSQFCPTFHAMANVLHPLFHSWVDRRLAHPVKDTPQSPDAANDDDGGNENANPDVTARKCILQNVTCTEAHTAKHQHKGSMC